MSVVLKLCKIALWKVPLQPKLNAYSNIVPLVVSEGRIDVLKLFRVSLTTLLVGRSMRTPDTSSMVL